MVHIDLVWLCIRTMCDLTYIPIVGRWGLGGGEQMVSLISFWRWARPSGSSMILAISTVTKSWYAAHFL